MDNPYLHGVGSLAADGLLIPAGERVLLRAITPKDYSSIATLDTFDTRGAIAFEVVRLGASVPKESGLEVGQHCVHLNAAADRLDDDTSSPWILVHHEDITAYWLPPGD